MGLEDELKKANTARSQLDTYKRQVMIGRLWWCLVCDVLGLLQVIDLHNKLSEETRRADKAEFEVKTKTEKMKSLESEKQVCCLLLKHFVTLYMVMLASTKLMRYLYFFLFRDSSLKRRR